MRSPQNLVALLPFGQVGDKSRLAFASACRAMAFDLEVRHGWRKTLAPEAIDRWVSGTAIVSGRRQWRKPKWAAMNLDFPSKAEELD